jgi:hypothetical protein
LGGDIESGDRQEEPEPGEGADRANLGFLEIPAIGLVIEESLLDIKPQAIFLEGVQLGRFITDDGPKLPIDAVVAKGKMHRAIALAFMKLNVMPTEGFPPLKVNVLQLAPPVTGPSNPSIALHPNPVVPA